ncbi:MAG TPA: hypothetical protein VGX23_23250 [Actinocrinis sp.]|nr:hypothetical protein [Actinocrinis sp.]
MSIPMPADGPSGRRRRSFVPPLRTRTTTDPATDQTSEPENRDTLAATAARETGWAAADTRRRAQLLLAAIWLLDGVLQYQPFMFTKDFGSQVLAPTAQGNPAVIADPITWAARIVTDHPVGPNAAFATIQLLLGLAIAWRPTVKAALAASVVWSLAVWWLGEGLGGVLTGAANPLNGAPGAVILYALIAVLVWPTDRTDGPFPAARPVGLGAARGLWFVLWGSLAYFTMQSANTDGQAMHDMIADMAQGQPGWLAAIGNHAATLVAGRGLTASIVLAVALAVVAVGVFLPVRLAALYRATLVLALVVSAVIWVVGEDLGGLFGGQGTDPNSGPVLALLLWLYWPKPTMTTNSTDMTEATKR